MWRKQLRLVWFTGVPLPCTGSQRQSLVAAEEQMGSSALPGIVVNLRKTPAWPWLTLPIQPEARPGVPEQGHGLLQGFHTAKQWDLVWLMGA